MAEIEASLREKYRKKNEKKQSSTTIWILSTVVSILLFAIGLIDFIIKYKVVNAADGVGINTYDLRTGADVTVYPAFGIAFIPTGNQGIIPPSINININDWFVLSLALFLGIPAFLIYLREARKLKAMDDNLPFLLREIADSQRIGMHLPRAIAEAAKRNYGPLTPDLKKLAAKVSWGVSFRDAMMSFRDNVNTTLTRQATILILEAEKSGGELEKIFDSATNHIQEQLDIKREREDSIQPYIFIIYISFLIFCVVIFVLFSTFFEQFGSFPLIVNNVETIVIPIHAFRVVFLYLIASQAFFSGLTAGKMGNGSIKVGTVHATALLIIGFLFYKLLIA